MTVWLRRSASTRPSVNGELDLELGERAGILLPDGEWDAADFLVPFARVWSVENEYLVSDFDRRNLSVPILICGRDGAATPAR